LRELYKPWGADKLEVNTRTAELIKYANNCLLATQISAMNEIANVAAAIGGIDVLDVVKGVSLDKRWSPIIADGSRVEPGILTYLLPGCGFGGSCFPKDVQALRSEGRRLGLPMQMLNAVLSINENQAAQVAEILKRTEGDLRDKRVLLLGLAFKPDTDDVRESASLIIADTLLDAGAVLVAHDPIARDNFVRSFGERSSQVRFVNDFNSEIVSADIIVVATRWAEYLVLGDLDLRGKTVFDARRLLSKDSLQCSRYLTIGYRNDDFV
jgi:UDPglucose 6-dehydrogenase